MTLSVVYALAHSMLATYQASGNCFPREGHGRGRSVLKFGLQLPHFPYPANRMKKMNSIRAACCELRTENVAPDSRGGRTCRGVAESSVLRLRDRERYCRDHVRLPNSELGQKVCRMTSQDLSRKRRNSRFNHTAQPPSECASTSGVKSFAGTLYSGGPENAAKRS